MTSSRDRGTPHRTHEPTKASPYPTSANRRSLIHRSASVMGWPPAGWAPGRRRRRSSRDTGQERVGPHEPGQRDEPVPAATALRAGATVRPPPPPTGRAAARAVRRRTGTAPARGAATGPTGSVRAPAAPRACRRGGGSPIPRWPRRLRAPATTWPGCPAPGSRPGRRRSPPCTRRRRRERGAAQRWGARFGEHHGVPAQGRPRPARRGLRVAGSQVLVEPEDPHLLVDERVEAVGHRQLARVAGPCSAPARRRALGLHHPPHVGDEVHRRRSRPSPCPVPVPLAPRLTGAAFAGGNLLPIGGDRDEWQALPSTSRPDPAAAPRSWDGPRPSARCGTCLAPHLGDEPGDPQPGNRC